MNKKCAAPKPYLAPWQKIILAAVSMALLSAGSATAGLRGNTEISGENITLGDLFDNAGDKTNTVVQHAPAPGRSMEFSINRLRALASDFQLAWQSPTFAGPVIIRRRGVRLYRDMVHRAILDELAQLGIKGNWNVVLNSLPENVWLPADAIEPDRFPIHGFMFNQQRGRFSALLKIPTDRGLTRNLRLAGQAYEMLKVVTLKRSISRGGVIRRQDVALRMFRANRIRSSVFSELSEVVGLQTKRPLRSGNLLLARDVQRKITIRKGAVVTILVITPTMTLSTVGRALAKAAIGDVIPVLNEQSKRTVKAAVVSHDTVRAIFRRRVAFNSKN